MISALRSTLDISDFRQKKFTPINRLKLGTRQAPFECKNGRAGKRLHSEGNQFSCPLKKRGATLGLKELNEAEAASVKK
jgi:hypothetical protein